MFHAGCTVIPMAAVSMTLCVPVASPACIFLALLVKPGGCQVTSMPFARHPILYLLLQNTGHLQPSRRIRITRLKRVLRAPPLCAYTLPNDHDYFDVANVLHTGVPAEQTRHGCTRHPRFPHHRPPRTRRLASKQHRCSSHHRGSTYTRANGRKRGRERWQRAGGRRYDAGGIGSQPVRGARECVEAGAISLHGQDIPASVPRC